MTSQEIYGWSIGIGVSWLTYDLIVSAMLASAPILTGEEWKWMRESIENGHRLLTRLLRAEGRATADVRDTVDRKVKAPDEEVDGEEERQMDGWGLYITTRISSKVTTFRKGVEFAVNITSSLVRKRRASAKIW